MNYINFNNLFHYLIEKKLLSLEEVSQKNIQAFIIQSRNINHVVLKPDHNDVFLKQLRNNDSSSISTIQQEALLLQETKKGKAFSFLSKVIPGFFLYDEINHTVISQYYRNSQDLFVAHSKQRDFVPRWGKMQAEILAEVHKKSFSIIQDKKCPEIFKKIIPWAFKFHYGPKEWFNLRSGADNYLFETVQNDEVFKKVIQELHDTWQHKTLIHGDVKMNNFLLVLENNKEKIKLIDWEIADVGDPAWDVAGVFQGYLARWGHNCKTSTTNGVKEFSAEMMELSLNEFWDEYSLQTNLFEENKIEFLSRTMKFAAVRLIQTCLEASHNDKNLAEVNARILQMSQNILRKPIIAARDLLGIKNAT